MMKESLNTTRTIMECLDNVLDWQIGVCDFGNVMLQPAHIGSQRTQMGRVRQTMDFHQRDGSLLWQGG